MQTILGAGGAIGNDLAKELKAYTDKIRLVSRNPKAVNPDDDLHPADITKADQVDKAVEGSKVVYLTVGFEYKVKVWEEKWPATMKNAISACKKHNAKLVFFDNVYMYDRKNMSNMTEDTPIRPTSRKGVIRADIAEMLFQEIRSGGLQGLVARSADFYGPKNSILIELVYKNLKKGGKANWLINADKIHNFTFTPDAAKATAILGNTPDAFGQVWHLPTDRTPLTGKDWVELFARHLNVKPKYRLLSPLFLDIVGLFVPVMKEMKEMTYQYDRDYLFNSSKFEKKFGFKPTTPEDGVKWVIKNL